MATQEQFDNIVRILIDKNEAEIALESMSNSLDDVEKDVQDVNDKFEETGEAVDEVNSKLDDTPGKVKKVASEANSGLPKVRGLGKAFEGVFGIIASKGGKAGATFGTIVNSVRGAIPMVQNLTKATVTGLGKVAGALASTGIGAIIIGIGAAITLITKHWEGFLYVIGSSKEEFQNLLDKVLEFGKKAITVIVGAGNVIVQNLVGAVKVSIESFKGLGQVMKDVFTFNWSKIKEDATKAINNIKTSWNRAWDIKGNYEQGKQYGEKFIEGVTTMINYKSKDAAKVAGAAGKEAGEEYVNAMFDTITKEMKNRKDLETATEAFKRDVLPGILKQLQEALEAEGNGDYLKFFTLDDLFPEDVMNKLGARYLKYMQELNAIQLQELHDSREYTEERKYIAETFSKDMEDILQGRSTQMKEEAEKELQESKDNLKEWRELKQERLQIEYEHQRAMLELDPTLPEFRKNQKMLELEQERLKQRKEYYEGLLKLEQEGSLVWEQIKLKIKEIDNILNQNQKKQKNNSQEGRFFPTKEEFDEVEGNFEALVQLLNNYWGKWEQVASSVSSTLGSLGDIYEQDSEAIKRNAEIRLKNHEISQEQYEKEVEMSKKQFERSKKLQIATTVINTIAGAIGAFLQATAAYPPPAGPIIGAASAAAATAAGIAQIQALKSKSFDSTDIGGSVSPSANVGVTPVDVRDDIQVSPTTLAQSQSPADQRVWILQSDLEDSHNQVEIREANSTF